MGGLAALRHGADADLSLTFEAQAAALQPALEVDDRLRARAAAIFEKEQEYVLEAAQPAPSRASRRELYITENGCAFTLISNLEFTDARWLAGFYLASCITVS
jgi:mediator of replication checkpoint protein 1